VTRPAPEFDRVPRCRRRRQRGFAGIMAILLLILVASTLAVLGWAAVVEARRSRATQDEAQLRQLLSAGAAAAGRMLDSSGDVSAGARDVAIPSELAGTNASLKLTFAPAGPDREQVEVRATVLRRQARQTVEFTRATGHWTVAAVSLAPDNASPATRPTPPATAPAVVR